MLLMKRKTNKEGLWYYVPKKPIVMKDVKSHTKCPGLDERDLLNNEQYVEAILATALQIENNLKHLLFYKIFPDNVDSYAEIMEMKFAQIICLSRAVKIITPKEYKIIHLLKGARNEIAHHPYLCNKNIDKDKCKSILEPCFKIIETTCIELSELQKKKRDKGI